MTEVKITKKWKMAIIVWIAIFPLIFSIMPICKPILLEIGLNPILTELLLIALLVILMVFVAQPILMELFRNWLNKEKAITMVTVAQLQN
ncbi:MAG: hypothetical protein JKY42_12200 [Flavobacteriales bacterium]|nr:hypothetical protein [Flavobacteriales bacterium]